MGRVYKYHGIFRKHDFVKGDVVTVSQVDGPPEDRLPGPSFNLSLISVSRE